MTDFHFLCELCSDWTDDRSTCAHKDTCTTCADDRPCAECIQDRRDDAAAEAARP